MPKSEASVKINSTIEKVFDTVADPEKMSEYASSSVLTNAKGEPGEPGSYAEYDYHVMGMKFPTKMTVSEVDKPSKLVQEMSGAMPGKWTWNLEKEGQAVQVDFCIDYRVPGGVLGKCADKLFLGKMNQKNLEKTLHNLKIYCEKQAEIINS
jgi:carbon monoxide dehydrogenase subunit G